MSIASPTTLLLAALLSSPTLYHAFVLQDVEASDAATRYLIAVPVAAVMLWLLKTVTGGYGRPVRRPGPARRATDADSDDVLEGEPPALPER